MELARLFVSNLFTNAVIAPIGKEKAKVVPQHTYGGAEGERIYSSYSFTTSAPHGVSGQSHVPAALCPLGKDPRCPLDRTGLDTEVRGKKSLASAGDRTSIALSSSP
jgi:hypothetical protein